MNIKTLRPLLRALYPISVVALWVAPTPALALFNDLQIYGYHNPVEASLVRILMMVLWIGQGFALGWFFAPQTRALRRKILLGVGAALVLVAVVNNGTFGWGAATLVSIFGFFAAIGYWIGTVVKSLGETPTTFGSAKWAQVDELRDHGMLNMNGIRLGQLPGETGEDVLSYQGDRHLLTVAPTRSGKGSSVIIPNLLSYKGSTLVVDPKGENALITALARHDMGQEVHIVDPWGVVTIEGARASRFNPLDWLVAGDVDITENAMLLADALVIKSTGSEAFWDEEAKALIQGVILYVATDEREAGQRHLGRVRDLLLLDGADLRALFERMLDSPHHVVASTGARALQKEEKLLSNVLASAQAQTHFLDSARIRESLSASDFKFEDLKTKQMSIYLVLPADRLNAFSRWLRLMVQQAVTVNARDISTRPMKPVLFILDEMPALGRLTMVEQAFGLMAGFGMQLHGIVQDMSQLKAVYGEGWETFVSNSGVVQYFGSRDRMTAEYFSALCGETTVWNLSSALARTFGTSTGGSGLSISDSTAETDTRAASQRKLAYPDELMRLHGDKQLVFVENMNPIIATRVPWYEDERLKAKGVNLHAG